MTNEWRDHIKVFIEKPQLRPYFEDGKELTPNDANTQAVLALADVRLDVIDGILQYAEFRGASDEIDGWKKTFTRVFAISPVLCSRFNATSDNYGLIIPIGQGGCSRQKSK